MNNQQNTPITHRCKWVPEDNTEYIQYHDTEWGKPLNDDRSFFELLTLEGFQAGLSWACVLKKRKAFRKAFKDFYPHIISTFTLSDVEILMQNKDIIRHRLKITSAITNASIFMEICREYGSFKAYLNHFTDGKTIFEPYTIRTTSPLSYCISKDLKKRGMRYVGSTIIYSFLQACGVINAHGTECQFYTTGK